MCICVVELVDVLMCVARLTCVCIYVDGLVDVCMCVVGFTGGCICGSLGGSLDI